MPVNWCQHPQCSQQPTRFYQRDAEHPGRWLCLEHAIASGFQHMIPLISKTDTQTEVKKMESTPVKVESAPVAAPKADASAKSKSWPRVPRPVICITTGQEFPGAKQAAKEFGISSIFPSLLHGYAIKGLRFRYKDSPEIPDPRGDKYKPAKAPLAQKPKEPNAEVHAASVSASLPDFKVSRSDKPSAVIDIAAAISRVASTLDDAAVVRMEAQSIKISGGEFDIFAERLVITRKKVAS